VVLTVWMFATSVVYPVQLVGGHLATLLALNPMTPIVDGYRAVLLRNESPITLPFLGAMAVSLILLCFCWVIFHRAEYTFAENM
jgi:homopolymeric O-antigen transport system permease protein